jgi:hypothetical protein
MEGNIRGIAELKGIPGGCIDVDNRKPLAD